MNLFQSLQQMPMPLERLILFDLQLPLSLYFLHRLFHLDEEGPQRLYVMSTMIGGGLALHTDKSSKLAGRSQADKVEGLLDVLLFSLAFGVF